MNNLSYFFVFILFHLIQINPRFTLFGCILVGTQMYWLSLEQSLVREENM